MPLLNWLTHDCWVQFAFNTLSRVSPVSHGVCNVVKRVVIIGTSVLFFGNKLTTKTKIGTAVALVGTYLYTEASKKYGKGHAASNAAAAKATPPPPPGPPSTGSSGSGPTVTGGNVGPPPPYGPPGGGDLKTS